MPISNGTIVFDTSTNKHGHEVRKNDVNMTLVARGTRMYIRYHHIHEVRKNDIIYDTCWRGSSMYIDN